MFRSEAGLSLETEVEEAAVDNCPENSVEDSFSVGDGIVLETTMLSAVDNCPERVDAVDAEAPRPPRIETGVEF